MVSEEMVTKVKEENGRLLEEIQTLELGLNSLDKEHLSSSNNTKEDRQSSPHEQVIFMFWP